MTLLAQNPEPRSREFNVLDFGARGDGTTLDTEALQRAIDAAADAEGPARVLVPGGRRYLCGTLELRGGMELHLAGDAELLASTRPEDYGTDHALLTARYARGLRITGTGRINGRSCAFMERYDPVGEWWIPKAFRPRLAVLTGCNDLEIRGITFLHAPHWTLHLVGCRDVPVDGITIRNALDVPNCDGIDPDHCRNVEIRNCDITCGDDAIVIKATLKHAAYGGSSHIHVHDCTLETSDCGLKIGTETTRDIVDVRFERCTIRSSCRGLGIQLRDEGDVRDIVFSHITFVSRYHADPWWGRGEAISFTAIPRTPSTKVGRIRGIRVQNITGRTENSVRISGCRESRIEDVVFDNVDITLDRWTSYRGGVWDNRPTTAYPAIEEHATPAIHVRYADAIELRRCRVTWGENIPASFTHAFEAHDVTGLTYDLSGASAHPDTLASVRIE